MGQPRDESLADEGHGDGGQDEIECLGGPGGVRMSGDAASSPLALVEAVPPLPSPPRLW